MKAKYLVIAALISAASFTSCSSEDVATEIQTSASTCPDVINVKFEAPVAATTRAIITGTDNKPVFEEFGIDQDTYAMYGDYIMVYSLNEENHVVYRSYNCTNSETGEFTVDESSPYWFDETNFEYSSSAPKGPYYIAYQNNSSFGYTRSHLDEFEIAAANGSFNSKPNEFSGVMAGKTDNLSNGVTLKNLTALLKVTVPEGSNVISICLEHFSDIRAYFDSNLDYTDSDMYIGVNPEYKYLENKGNKLESGVYYIPILPQELRTDGPDGEQFSFRLMYSTTDLVTSPINYSSFNIRTKVEPVTLEAGKIYNLGTLDF